MTLLIVKVSMILCLWAYDIINARFPELALSIEKKLSKRFLFSPSLTFVLLLLFFSEGIHIVYIRNTEKMSAAFWICFEQWINGKKPCVDGERSPDQSTMSFPARYQRLISNKRRTCL